MLKTKTGKEEQGMDTNKHQRRQERFMSAQKQNMSGKRHFHRLTPLTVERFPLTDRLLTCLVKRGGGNVGSDGWFAVAIRYYYQRRHVLRHARPLS